LSQELIRQLDGASKEVNREIADSFSGCTEPKDLYAASNHLINAGGKRLRPFLVLKSCELTGGWREDALKVAVAIELVHNFSLVHDDIMDNDDKRRGVPTVHVKWGIPMALLSGDMLFAKAYDAIVSSAKTRKIPPRRILKVFEVVTDATISLCEGQALDMLFEERSDVSEREYLDMIGKKTAALIEAAAKSGALIGNATYKQVEALGRFGRYAGVGFQIMDDVLGLTADEKVLGKPVGSDIREGKRTMILINALSKADASHRGQILSVLGNKVASSDKVEDVIELIQSLGSVDYAAKMAEKFIEKAKSQLTIFPPSANKEVLLNLCDYIISRKY